MTVAEITIIGYLGRNPDMHYMPSGKAVTNFSVAATREWKDSNNQKVKETTWFKIATFDKQAENCNKYLTKGSQVYIKGRLGVDAATGGPKIYTKNDGTVATSFEVSAFDVRFLSSKQNKEPAADPAEDGAAPADAEPDGFPL